MPTTSDDSAVTSGPRALGPLRGGGTYIDDTPAGTQKQEAVDLPIAVKTIGSGRVIVVGKNVEPVKNWTSLNHDPQFLRNVVDHLYLSQPDALTSYVFPLMRQPVDIKCVTPRSVHPETIILPVVDNLSLIVAKGLAPPTVVSKDKVAPHALILTTHVERCNELYNFGKTATRKMTVKLRISTPKCQLGLNFAQFQRGCNILCATFSRASTLINLRALSLSAVRFLVIDRVDEVLNDEPTLAILMQEILSAPDLPSCERRQTMVLATNQELMPQEAQQLDGVFSVALDPNHVTIREEH
ncbi:putative DED1-ATP-dependent RNA helicase [Aphelenchoides avenae]|nr:putative DED1-ATP-dependent RNA helicase [Aphelenchus avenae]